MTEINQDPGSVFNEQVDGLGEYSEFLARRLADSSGLKRSAKTRLTLLIGAVRALNAHGLRMATVETIVHAAGLSHSTFYLHFPSKNAIAATALTGFMTDMLAVGRLGPPPSDEYERASRATLHYVRAFRANPGLARSLLQLNDEEDAVFDDARAKFGAAWYAQSTHSLLKHFPGAKADPQQFTFGISAMGGMIDDFLRRWVVHRQPELVTLVNDVAANDEAVAEALTVLWWRALVGEPPKTRASIANSLANGIGEVS